MQAPSIAEWINLGGLGVFAMVVYLEMRGLRRDLNSFIERLLNERDVTPVHGVPITRGGRYRQHRPVTPNPEESR